MVLSKVITMCIIITYIEGVILCFNGFDLSIFNPIRNYKKWKKLNWFGIGNITLLLNIIFIPYAICYWIYKLVTVGRK